MDWASAFSYCNAFNMTLATLETEEEHNHLLNLADNGGVTNQHAFIGGTDVGSEGTFHWVGSGKLVNYPLKWKDGEPNNLNDNEHCLGLWKETDQYEINDAPCSGYSGPFICELLEETVDIDPRVD